MKNPFTRILAIGALAATLVCGLTPSAQALTLPVTSVRDVAGTAPADPVHWRRWGWGGYGYGWRRPYYGYGWRRPYYYGYYRPWRPVYYRPLYYRPVVYRRPASAIIAGPTTGRPITGEPTTGRPTTAAGIGGKRPARAGS